ncbi:MAG: isopentenyl-diphosphate Delta-isomerase [Alphaproteobacteria bacterium]|nr:isopentenyl-diphosphate Delta-isomerase [Alphaproteobacteria bacterium]
MLETVILVDERDCPLGSQKKLAAHLIPQRHRAFSILVFNHAGETLIQRRAMEKYHSPGLWANSCCGHPRPGEDIKDAASRRLREELGFFCPLSPVTTVCYTLKLEKNLWELEYTHVFKGTFEEEISFNVDEVSEVQWISPTVLREDVLVHPERYARWFRLYVLKYFESVFGEKALTP